MREINIPKRYYNGTKLLSELDIDGKKPGIYMSNVNRSAGKTTFFLIEFLKEYLDNGKKFVLISRLKNEIENSETMFEYVIDTYFPDVVITSKIYVKNLVMGIYANNKLCGYAICLKDASKLKKYSAIFGDVDNGLFDELQPEDGRYIRGEVDLFTSIIKTVSRGNGEQVRYVRWVLLSNNISILNPYFLNMGIYKMIPEDLHLTKDDPEYYVKGTGYVCEFGYNPVAAKQAAENPALRSFTSNNNKLSTSADFMINANAFIVKKAPGKMDYVFTLKYGKKYFGVRKVRSNGWIYITSSYDPSFKFIVALTDADHDELTVQLTKFTFSMQKLRDAYSMGTMRFSDLEAKNTIIEILGIDLYRQ